MLRFFSTHFIRLGATAAFDLRHTRRQRPNKRQQSEIRIKCVCVSEVVCVCVTRVDVAQSLCIFYEHAHIMYVLCVCVRCVFCCLLPVCARLWLFWVLHGPQPVAGLDPVGAAVGATARCTSFPCGKQQRLFKYREWFSAIVPLDAACCLLQAAACCKLLPVADKLLQLATSCCNYIGISHISSSICIGIDFSTVNNID